jgi:hypothetical protein
MKKLMMTVALGAATIAMSAPAGAAVLSFDKGDYTSGSFSNTNVAKGDFTDTLSFTIAKDGTLVGSATNNAIKFQKTGDLDFTPGEVFLLGPGGSKTIFDMVDNTGLDSTFKFNIADLAAGNYTLSISGHSFSNTASYGGQMSFAASAVPEPAVWGMMIMGFGAIGYGMRRRKVTFAKTAIA